LVPKQNFEWGKDRNTAIVICAALFTAGALAVIRYARIHGIGQRPWLTKLLARQ
jgi:transposase